MKTHQRIQVLEACGERLYDADGNAVAYCIQPTGMEHSHADLTPHEAVKRGLAAPIVEPPQMRKIGGGSYSIVRT